MQENDDMRYLSQEEQECIQFFEDTIISLEESLNEDDQRSEQMPPAVEEVGGHLTSSPNPGVTVSSLMASPLSHKDQDIIDLVQPEPDLVQTKESNFIPPSPGNVLQLFLLWTNIVKNVFRPSNNFAICPFQIYRVCCQPLKATLR